MAGVAQSVRAPGCGPGGRRFNSGHSPHFVICVLLVFLFPLRGETHAPQNKHFPRPSFLKTLIFEKVENQHTQKELTIIIMNVGYDYVLTQNLFKWLPSSCYFGVNPYIDYDDKLLYRLRHELNGKILVTIPSQIARTLSRIQLEDILRHFKDKIDGFLIQDIYSDTLLKINDQGHALVLKKAKELNVPVFFAYPSITFPHVKEREVNISNGHIEAGEANTYRWKKLTERINDVGSAIVTVDFDETILESLKKWMQKQIKKFPDLKISNNQSITPLKSSLEHEG